MRCTLGCNRLGSMTNRYGIVTPPAIGHLNPMVALALELRRRGDEVVLFTVAERPALLCALLPQRAGDAARGAP